jgi:hypothetical protein
VVERAPTRLVLAENWVTGTHTLNQNTVSERFWGDGTISRELEVKESGSEQR